YFWTARLKSCPDTTSLLPLELLDHFHYHGADGLQALRAQLVHGVVVGVPRRVVEVDQVDGWSAALDEGHVIVVNRLRFVYKRRRVAEVRGGLPHQSSQRRVPIGLALDVEMFVADHVDVDQGFQLAQGSILLPALGQMPAAVEIIGIAPLLA